MCDRGGSDLNVQLTLSGEQVNMWMSPKQKKCIKAKCSQSEKLSLCELWRGSGDRMLREKLDFPWGKCTSARGREAIV